MKLEHIGLFEGIGGFSLAAEMMGWNTLAQCEILPFAQKVLKYHFPNAIQHGDIKTTDFSIYRGKCDILTGGFPCQGFSVAGLRLGTDDNRYLWPEYLRAIDEIKPPFILGENVTGILSMEDKSGIYRDVFPKVESSSVTRLYSFDQYQAVYSRQAKMLVNSICESLEERGYEVQTFAVPAASVGAPHKRERIWFVAYSNSLRIDRTSNTEASIREQSNKKQQRNRGAVQTNRLSPERVAPATRSGTIINPKCNDDGGHISGHGEGNGMAVVGNKLDKAGWEKSSNNIKSPGIDAPKKRRAKRTPGWAAAHPDSIRLNGSISEHEKQPGKGGEHAQRNASQGIGHGDNTDTNQLAGGTKPVRTPKRPISAGVITNSKSKGGGRVRNSCGPAGPREGNELPGSEYRVSSPQSDANSVGIRLRGRGNGSGISGQYGESSKGNYWENWPTQSPVCIGDDGVPTKLDGITFSNWRNESIKGGGNAVVPQVVVEFYKAIESLIKDESN